MKTNKNFPKLRVGAPLGLTFLWLHMEFVGDFTKAYKLSFNLI